MHVISTRHSFYAFIYYEPEQQVINSSGKELRRRLPHNISHTIYPKNIIISTQTPHPVTRGALHRAELCVREITNVNSSARCRLSRCTAH